MNTQCNSKQLLFKALDREKWLPISMVEPSLRTPACFFFEKSMQLIIYREQGYVEQIVPWL